MRKRKEFQMTASFLVLANESKEGHSFTERKRHSSRNGNKGERSWLSSTLQLLIWRNLILPREATHKPNGAWGSGEQSEMQKALEVIVK